MSVVLGDQVSVVPGEWDIPPTSLTYQWQSSPNGSTSWSNISGAVSSVYQTVSGDLTNYLRCGVTAINAGGSSSVSYSQVVGPVSGSATVPGAPTGVSGSSGNNLVVVSFTPPSSNGGSNITSYTVTGSPSGSVTGGSSPLTVTGLTDGTPYTFTVTATNGIGTSSASSPSSPVTPSLVTHFNFTTSFQIAQSQTSSAKHSPQHRL